MQYQIDFLPVGEKKCGEAIAMRYGDLESGDPNKQTVVLIDGGFRKDSEQSIKMVTEHYGAPKINLMVSTHPDIDHINGLPGVLKSLPVDNLWMHLPWEHSGDFLASRQEDFSTAAMTKYLQKSMQSSSDLAVAADAAGVTLTEPFTGRRFISPYGTLTVLGPTMTRYEELLTQILDKSAIKSSQQSTQGGILAELTRLMQTGIQAVANKIESHPIETLTDNGDAGPSNDTSTILLLELADGSKKFLFCGDAGMPSLEFAYSEYAARGHGPGELALVQVPHHGSRKNVGPTILNKFLGDKTAHPDMNRGQACVSVGKECEGDGHPKKVATNAFKRRGYPVHQTRGEGIKFGMPRPGWTGTSIALPLYETVEADE
jgi:beta-lactamase superfamily II metal-dependent hydrolase